MKVDEIPWALPSVMPNTQLSRDIDDSFMIEYQDSNQLRKRMGFRGLDFHAMGKKDVGDIVETDRRTRLFNSSN